MLQVGLVHVANAIVARSAIGGLFEREDQLDDLGLCVPPLVDFGLNPVALEIEERAMVATEPFVDTIVGLGLGGALQTADVRRSRMAP